MSEELDSLFEEEEEVVTEENSEVITEPTGEEEPSTPEEGQESEDQEEQSEESEDKNDQGLYAAMKEERRKRQEFERRTQALEQQLQAIQQGLPKEEVDYFTNPEKVIEQQIQAVRNEFQSKFFDMSEQAARSKYKDFDDIAEYFFGDMASGNQALIAEAQSKPDPYEWIYQTAAKHKLVNEVGDVNSLREKIAAEERQKLEAGMKAKIEEEIQKRTKLPGSLSNAPGTSTPKAGEEDDSLENVLGR